MITEYEFEHLNAIVYLIICGSIIHFHLLQISYQNITINLIGNELPTERSLRSNFISNVDIFH